MPDQALIKRVDVQQAIQATADTMAASGTYTRAAHTALSALATSIGVTGRIDWPALPALGVVLDAAPDLEAGSERQWPQPRVRQYQRVTNRKELR